MEVVIQLPDEMAEDLKGFSADMPKEFLEAFAVDAYRRGRLTGLQVRRLLGLETRFDLEDLLRRAQLMHEYAPGELNLDYECSHRVSSQYNAGK